MNKAEEDYLKLIYELSTIANDSYIKTAELAEHFGYTFQSVNEMVKKLQQKGLVEFQPYKGVQLTSPGRKHALRMIRAHRLWEVFLSERLGLEWSLLHEEAELLEHATSEVVLERLYEYLGKPAVCNHGNPIPDAHGTIARAATFSLYDAHIGAAFIVLRVHDHKPLLHYLSQRQIHLGDTLTLITKDSFAGILTVSHGTNTHAFSKHIAKMVFGKLRENEPSQ